MEAPYHDTKHDVAEMKRCPSQELRLAAAAIRFDVRLRSSDMPVHMQEHALRCTRSFVNSSPERRPNNTLLARSLKKVKPDPPPIVTVSLPYPVIIP
ncbi:hypothetical protein MLD38_002276 [Melastoma candidum]|uniref:Uncharacterized protein n=1 Tax=Melastoma candidum TaxID=119954 RepID=A0ACB9SFW7_9MYRT|nr:hypothetical protein MLD38_002276 [Melastoma candidum]